MKELAIKYSRYKDTRRLSEAQRALLAEARKALRKSYSPYSGFKVGAAVELANGKVLSGANFENASYPLCLCAERVALAAAAAQYPGVPVVRMALTVSGGSKAQTQPVAPCGACRQVILEVQYKQKQPMELILRGEKGEILVIPNGGDLLPFGFSGDFL